MGKKGLAIETFADNSIVDAWFAKDLSSKSTRNGKSFTRPNYENPRRHLTPHCFDITARLQLVSINKERSPEISKP